MTSSVTVELLGGLGNQLFGYHMGLAAAALSQRDLVVDVSETRHGFTDHGIGILDFRLSAHVVKEKHASSWSPFRNARALRAREVVSGRIWNPVLRRLPNLTSRVGVYVSASPGFEPGVLSLRSPRRLRGYFQSWRYVELANRLGAPRRLSLCKRSPWLESTLAQAARLEPIALHVRLGDYGGVPQFGVLDPEYYRKAIALLRQRGLDGPLWLFSDQLDLAQQRLATVGIRIDECVSSPDGPASELLAMASGRAVVMSNSTFSWWGAWMRGEDAHVIAPHPWFRQFPEPQDLIPPAWERISATHDAHV